VPFILVFSRGFSLLRQALPDIDVNGSWLAEKREPRFCDGCLAFPRRLVHKIIAK